MAREEGADSFIGIHLGSKRHEPDFGVDVARGEGIDLIDLVCVGRRVLFGRRGRLGDGRFGKRLVGVGIR